MQKAPPPQVPTTSVMTTLHNSAEPWVLKSQLTEVFWDVWGGWGGSHWSLDQKQGALLSPGCSEMDR